ncbi:MAG: repeat-containing protein [Chthoniobacteraceae bacterium]|nr:repeat-containing protein [Chthoniobacteraceae bacterium]
MRPVFLFLLLLVLSFAGVHPCQAALAVTYNSTSDVPVTANGFSAQGETFSATLNFAPPAGTTLTVIRNTGLGFINGTFVNLAQGETVMLTHAGINYRFVANYYGGTGNDLVLVWAQTRPVSWGYNRDGQLGDNSTTDRSVPVNIFSTGLFAGRTIVAMAAGGSHSLALCADGTLAAWGAGSSGQLGVTSTGSRILPSAVNDSGVLAGRQVISIAAGGFQSLALCSDGKVAAWGRDLGNGSQESSDIPVAVDTTGVLAGKTVVAVAAGYVNSAVLCSDGTLAAWGFNSDGRLGDGTTTTHLSPVALNTGALGGKTVTAVSLGNAHGVALCADGTVVCWGSNDAGQLGNNGPSDISLPVAVNMTGVLAGKTVVAVSAGSGHNLALCSDGTVAAWGYNLGGQLGNNSIVNSQVPVAVDKTGVLAGKTVIAISAGASHSLALCADGTLAAWGYGIAGSLGNGSWGGSLVPVAVSRPLLAGDARYTAAFSASQAYHNLALAATQPLPVVANAAATNLARNSATLNGTVNPSGNSTTAQFEFGLTKSYGSKRSVTLSPGDGLTPQLVSANLGGLTPGTIYHYRLTATNAFGIAVGTDGTFATSISVAATYLSASTIPVTAGSFSAAGEIFSATLNFAPATGTNLTVVKKTGAGFINGTFGNLAQGQLIALSYNGISYPFIANYYGGTGNDLVLQWARNRVAGWGSNQTRQVGDNSFTNRLVPVDVLATGVLAGKTVVSSAAGHSHSVALCSDGTVAIWGNTNPVPVALSPIGALAGKTVVAIAAGETHSLALCSDGTVAAWGSNIFGELGNQSTVESTVPVAVNTAGVLSGKTAVAIAAGRGYSLALCSDGTIVGWGANFFGQLGTDSTIGSTVPLAVYTGSVLAGKTVVALAAGYDHTLALCSDGTVAAWGKNDSGQLGNNNLYDTPVPVEVQATGALSGKTVIAVSAGRFHSLALCQGGTVVAWGANYYGELGNNSTTFSWMPVAVNTAGVLSGKTVVGVAAGEEHSVAQCSDGTVAAWGANGTGQLGTNNILNSSVPVAVGSSLLVDGERYGAIFSGGIADHNFALITSPLTPVVQGLPPTNLTSAGVTLNGTVNPYGSATTVSFDYGPNTSYGSSRSVTLSPNNSLAVLNVSSSITGLSSGATYHYRLTATNAFETRSTADDTFTIGTDIDATFSSAADVSLTAGSFSAPGGRLSIALAFAPPNGTNLMVVKNTGREFIKGNFDTLAHGDVVTLAYKGINYRFIANYFGGNGNDFVLQWANTKVLAWGANLYGQIGNNNMVRQAAPVSVMSTGALSGRLVVSGSTGLNHSLAACSDGTLLAWGENLSGQLGIKSNVIKSIVPTEAFATGALLGRKVIAVAAGERHSLALCSDGTVAAFGYNGSGQLGSGTQNSSSAPVAVSTAGVLAGKTVITVAAGTSHSLALCSDGTVAAWGLNGSGQLGNGLTSNSNIPVAVSVAGVLTGKIVIAVAAGTSHSLALCSDGTVAAWGLNSSGQLGNGLTSNSNIPVRISTAGVLSGKTATAMAAGTAHSLALCSDGTVAAWGLNNLGQLGNGLTGNSNIPVRVSTAGILSGKTVTAMAAGTAHSLALCSDGTLAAWGLNSSGQLGDNTTVQSLVPIAAKAPSSVDERYIALFSGPLAIHNLAVSAIPPSPVSITLPVTNLTGGSVSLNGTANAASGSATVSFDYGLTTAYGGTIAALPSPVTGSTETTVSADLPGLPANTTFHYRLSVTTAGGTSNGMDMTFTTSGLNAPIGGTVTLTPAINAGGTLSVVFANWTSPDMPLTFSLLIDDVVASATGESASREIIAPVSAGTHILKARIYAAHGVFTEVTKNFTVDTAQESWRAFHFGSTQNAGNAADLADPDGDGISNLVEYVAGLVPTSAASRFNVRVERVNGQPAIIFGPVIPGRTYRVKYKAALADATWTPLTTSSASDNGTERTIIDVSPGGGARFYTIEITLP